MIAALKCAADELTLAIPRDLSSQVNGPAFTSDNPMVECTTVMRPAGWQVISLVIECSGSLMVGLTILEF